MTLRWQQMDQAITKQGSPASSVQPNDSLNWAEAILKRLSKTNELAIDLAQAFNEQQLGGQFKLLHIMHIPGRSLKVLCSFSDLIFNQYSAKIILLKFYPESEYLQKFEKEKALALNPHRIALLDQWCAIAKLFPEDGALPHLEKMLDLPFISNILNIPEAAAKTANWQLLSYQEGRRCTLLYRYNSQPSSPGNAYVGKLQLKPEETANSHQRLRLLWDNPERKFNMPKPIAYDEQHGLRFETFCSGENIEQAMQNQSLDSLLNLVVTHLFDLHHLDISGLKPITPNIVLGRIEKKILPRMHIDIPEYTTRTEAILAKLNDNINWVQNTQTVTLHGDFHIANFLIHEDNLTFIDLDDLAHGDPCFDLALFASRLLLRNLQGTNGIEDAINAAANLPVFYNKLSRNMIRAETFAWYIAALFVGRQIKVCMRTNAANKPYLIHQLLSWAEQTMTNGYFSGKGTL